MFDFTASYTDQYELAMSQVYFLDGHKNQRTVFDYFFRKLPFGGGYAVFAGLEDLLDILENLYFNDQDIEFLLEQGLHPDFIAYLREFHFRGDVYSCREGDIVFPLSPVVTVEADIIEAQIVETLVLNMLNFQTLIATKASRMRQVAGDALLIDFGLRRAHAAGGYHASRAAIIGGFDATSNVRAGRDYRIPVAGTMAHSFIQYYDDELRAFRAFAEKYPDDCVLLVDTYDTLDSGLPNAIKVGLEMKCRGQKLKAIRLDSGDLAYLATSARQMLDNAGLQDVKIVASNQLDEQVIKSLREQGAPIDIFGVGTSLVTGVPDAALDGVYKLASCNGEPRIKLSETREKITLPFAKQVFRVLNNDGKFFGADVVVLADETDVDCMYHPHDSHKSLSLTGYAMAPLMQKVMENGRRLEPRMELATIREYSRERLKLLPAEYRRFDNPHLYKIGLSEKLKRERDRLIVEHATKVKNENSGAG